jgi:hypothetical protein
MRTRLVPPRSKPSPRFITRQRRRLSPPLSLDAGDAVHELLLLVFTRSSPLPAHYRSQCGAGLVAEINAQISARIRLGRRSADSLNTDAPPGRQHRVPLQPLGEADPRMRKSRSPGTLRRWPPRPLTGEHVAHRNEPVTHDMTGPRQVLRSRVGRYSPVHRRCRSASTHDPDRSRAARPKPFERSSRKQIAVAQARQGVARRVTETLAPDGWTAWA